MCQPNYCQYIYKSPVFFDLTRYSALLRVVYGISGSKEYDFYSIIALSKKELSPVVTGERLFPLL